MRRIMIFACAFFTWTDVVYMGTESNKIWHDAENSKSAQPKGYTHVDTRNNLQNVGK